MNDDKIQQMQSLVDSYNQIFKASIESGMTDQIRDDMFNTYKRIKDLEQQTGTVLPDSPSNRFKVSIGEEHTHVDRQKGKSLLEFPSSFVCVDTETTGLDPEYDEIIEIGAIRYQDGKETVRFSSLIQPKSYSFLMDDDDIAEANGDYVIIDGQPVQYVDSFITELTGITNKMLETAPKIEEVLPEFLKFAGDSVIVGHNINFDINFIYDARMKLEEKPFDNDFVDTMRISRRLSPEDRHHRLKDLAERFEINYSHAHRAVDDAEITIQCLAKLRELAVQKNGTDDLSMYLKNASGHHRQLDVKNIVPDPSMADPDNPLYGKSICITGTLEKMIRKDALQLVANIGGIPTDSVTKKTDILVLGNNDYCKAIKGGKSNKQKKAEKLILGGQDLQIMSENVFMSLLNESD